MLPGGVLPGERIGEPPAGFAVVEGGEAGGRDGKEERGLCLALRGGAGRGWVLLREVGESGKGATGKGLGMYGPAQLGVLGDVWMGDGVCVCVCGCCVLGGWRKDGRDGSDTARRQALVWLHCAHRVPCGRGVDRQRESDQWGCGMVPRFLVCGKRQRMCVSSDNNPLVEACLQAGDPVQESARLAGSAGWGGQGRRGGGKGGKSVLT